MKTKETVNLYRTLSVAAVVVVTLGLTAVVCLDSHFYPDEWLCLLFLDILFLMISATPRAALCGRRWLSASAPC